MSDWLDKLTKEVRNWTETPPKNFYSVSEIAQKMGVRNGQAARIMKRQLDLGKVQRVKVKSCVNGNCKVEFYYGPKK